MSHALVQRVSGVEIPVSNLGESLKWYTEILGLHIQHRDEHTAMMSYRTRDAATVFLVETQDERRLVFENTNWGIKKNGVIDFYTPRLQETYEWMKDKGVDVGPLNLREDGPSGFGVKDPDGNYFGVSDANHNEYV